MNWPPSTKSWVEFIPECFWYLFPGLFYHIVAILLTLGLYFVFTFTPIKLPRLRSVLLFHTCLIITAMLANGIWSCTIWGNYYWTVDYTSDFSAFTPIARVQIDYSWGEDITGGLNGVSLVQLNQIWLGFVAFTWLAAFGLTFLITHRKKNLVEQVAASDR